MHTRLPALLLASYFPLEVVVRVGVDVAECLFLVTLSMIIQESGCE